MIPTSFVRGLALIFGLLAGTTTRAVEIPNAAQPRLATTTTGRVFLAYGA